MEINAALSFLPESYDDIKYKKSKKCLSSEKNYDPYDAEEYDNADDFAEEFGDGDYDEGYDDAYDYWEERD